MRRYISFVFSIIITISANGQMKADSMGDEWFNSRPRIKVGDTMPDIPLGDIRNVSTNITKFSDLKGKLVILDIWNTACSYCIAAFPKMEEIQKKFDDKIQIIIVNPSEDQTQIDQALYKRNQIYRKLKNPKQALLPNLPSIVNAKNLFRLFPVRAVPHHVWIDKDGIIRVIGGPENTNEKKIIELLNGNNVSYLKDDNNTPWFNDRIPYFNYLKKPITSKEYNSVITPYCRDYSARTSGVVKDLVDSINQTIRNTWVNSQIWDLYIDAFPDFFERANSGIIFSSYPINTIFSVKDTSIYTNAFMNRKMGENNITDLDFAKTRVCYEQIVPLQYSQIERSKKMQTDLNNYFGRLLGTKVTVEKKRILCYLLRWDKEAKRQTSRGNNIYAKTWNDRIRSLIRNDQFGENIKELGFYLIDDEKIGELEAWDENNLTQSVNSIAELKSYLNKVGLDIATEEREIEFMVIKENN